MTPTQVALLLDELCIRYGFCLPASAMDRLQNDPPADVNAFTDAVFLAEGLDPQMEVSLRRTIRACVADHFGKAEDEALRAKYADDR